MVTECCHVAGLQSMHARIILRATNVDSAANLRLRLAKDQERDHISEKE